ncbi:hypothetical protein AZE42_10696, partial [Rhizopogon vesiculosus]
SAYYC